MDVKVVNIIPPRPKLLISEGGFIKLDQPLTSNPKVGGFGQRDAKIVLKTHCMYRVFCSLHLLFWHKSFWFLKRNISRKFNCPKAPKSII